MLIHCHRAVTPQANGWGWGWSNPCGLRKLNPAQTAAEQDSLTGGTWECLILLTVYYYCTGMTWLLVNEETLRRNELLDNPPYQQDVETETFPLILTLITYFEWSYKT